ncbi:hypothetical protein PAXRUDRAFT_434831 [Paxillus rubicundulus Ve08.2h10]|uniref:Uncharacterized protein n=1 Tax=Paxillus rubicundulus Ve08.2h10 TaxID=930991 RepID=A0A0D0E2A4_9AGAM|nr:hypothetical protein PAXRUDRAFT_434831 [Paxillus rubicundulus Ve08.2h10]
MATAYLEYRPIQNHVITPAGPPLHQPVVDKPLRDTLHDLTDTARDLAESALCREIETLCHATLAIDQAFYDIGQKLSEATKQQQQRVELYTTCCDLETRWKQHHETYKQLLRRSRHVAGKAQCAVDDFCEHFLPCLRDPSTTLSERRQLVRDQIEELEDGSNTSHDITQECMASLEPYRLRFFVDFVLVLDFGRTLDTYIVDFSRAVEGLSCGEQPGKIHTHEHRLRSTKAAMDMYVMSSIAMLTTLIRFVNQCQRRSATMFLYRRV